MRLFIAEKPDMGRKIASFLPGPHVKKPGYIETGGGMVSWCIGHILEQAQPGAYGAQYEKFPGSMDDLPVAPSAWKMEPIDTKKRQLAVLRDLLKKCTEVVHAGDPGREGQLIVDEVLQYLGNRKPVHRLLLNALDKTTVTRALGSLQPNANFKQLYDAALGRQRADWMVGMNLSRAYTILGSRQGYRGVLSIGRVQTPTLAIVVRREEEIEAFVPKDFWTVHALFGDDPESFWTTWIPPGGKLEAEGEENEDEEDEGAEEDEASDPNTGGGAASAAAPWQDEKRRVVVQKVAQDVLADAKAAGRGTVVKAEAKPALERAPLPHELSSLQSEADKVAGATLKQALEACQSLYEKGWVSYPRSDCSYLPTSQHADAPAILAAVAAAMPQLAPFMAKADPTRMSRAFDDKKMEGKEHHGIVPTSSTPPAGSLQGLEAMVYDTIVKRYLAQFLPDCEVDQAKIEVECGGHLFGARGRVVRVAGWRELLTPGGAGDDGKKQASLPVLQQGQEVLLREGRVDTHTTTPPARYTQGTLGKVMKRVHLLVTDPVARKKLKAVEGIGRAATRPAIIETLVRREFLKTEKKFLVPSTMARILVGAAPKALTDPGLTAQWENALDAVATGKVGLSVFEQKQLQWITGLLTLAKTTSLPPPPPEFTWQGPGNGGAGGKGKKPPAKGKACPKCGKGVMAPRKVKAGPHAGKKFKGCTNFPECKHSEWPK